MSKLFLNTVQNMVELVVIVDPAKKDDLATSLQFINANELEDRYVHALISDISDPEVHKLQPQLREEFIRNRFRNYMNRMRLFTEGDQPLRLKATLTGSMVEVTHES